MSSWGSKSRCREVRFSRVRKIMKVIVCFLVFLSCASVANEALEKEKIMSAEGTFDVKLEPQKDADAPAGRMTIFKEYSGDMVGKGVGQMISKRTQGGASVYSAIEEFKGTVNGKAGAFTLFHNGYMSSSKQSLEVTIVEGSGEGELKGIQGSLSIVQESGNHKYVLEYSF